MNFSEIINRLTENTQGSLPLFGPELCVVGTIVLLLLVRLFDSRSLVPGYAIAILGSVLALILAATQLQGLQRTAETQSVEMFTGLLRYDAFTVYFRIFLLLFVLFVEHLTVISGIPDREDAPDFYVLLLGSTLGMMLMASANHLLMVFLAVEMTSVPSYAMVGFLKGRRAGSEAALKYVVYGAGASGVMLYGISLLSGLLGTASLPQLTQALVEFGKQHSELSDPAMLTLSFGILTVLVGIAFKLSLFPFHFWCPDAFEGAAAEVAGFLSVASKGAAFALLVRFCLALVGQSRALGDLSPLYLNVGLALGVVAAVTATYGNLAAYTQSNIKRLLAYSTIAHAGYMLMAVSAMMVILNAPAGGDVTAQTRVDSARLCIQGLLYYLAVYFFMNLGAFAIVALIRNQTFSEEIADYAGLGWQAPALGAGMLICMFSLVGMPPFGGFFGKFAVFASVITAAQQFHQPVMWAILVIGLANTVFSLFYYLRVLRVMYLTPASPDAPPVRIPLWSDAGGFVMLVSLPVLALGIFVNLISIAADDVARWLF